MDVISLAQNLMKFRTETGNCQEINKCMTFCRNLFKGSKAYVDIFSREGLAPVIFIRNQDVKDFDVLVLGHLDVVPAADKMFEPVIENGCLYGRGALDMKSFAAVALHSMEYVLKNKLNLKFGIILSSDEEKGSKGTEAFLQENSDLKAKIVLDNDVGGNILSIVTKCKNPVFVKIIAEGKAAHGSTPWEGIDANQLLLEALTNLRKIYPYYSLESGAPANTWVDTVHVAKMSGGEVSNIIAARAEALLDFRLTEDSNVEELKNKLERCCPKGVHYEIVSVSTPVVMDEENPHILNYKKLAEEILGQKIDFEHIGGATDSRAFAVKGSTVIMHSGSGDGMHADNEYVEIDSVKKIADIQIRFLQKIADSN